MVCGRPLSPRGTRIVAQGRMGQDGKPCWVTGMVRWLFECRTPGCTGGCRTAYEPGGQPHRRYGLDVVIAAVELASEPGATLTSVAKRLDCDRSTVARWLIQVATTGGLDKLISLCARLDPDGLPPPLHAGRAASAFPRCPRASRGGNEGPQGLLDPPAVRALCGPAPPSGLTPGRGAWPGGGPASSIPGLPSHPGAGTRIPGNARRPAPLLVFPMRA